MNSPTTLQQSPPLPWYNVPRTRWGAIVTAVWLVGFGWWSLHCELPKGGNEWGDWAAGMFAPVAFLWLVLGYFQQGEELRLQAHELQNSVTQQTELARSTERQARLLEISQRLAVHAQVAEYQPVFTDFEFRSLSVDNGDLRMAFTNKGMAARELIVRVAVLPGNPSTTFPLPLWASDQTIETVVGPVAQDAINIELQIDYKDPLFVAQTQWFRVHLQGNKNRGARLKADLEGVTARLPPMRD
jgi:hypothetical protein